MEVPRETVTLTLSADSLLELPDGALYRAQHGRASVEVTKGREAGTIVVYASCDSLQRLVEAYERRLATTSSDSAETKESSETTETRAPSKKTYRWWIYAVMLAVGAAGGVAITRKTMNNKNK